MSDGGGIVRRVSTREVYRNRWMAVREDEIRPGLTRDEALANAPKGGRDGEFFRVQQVLEERP